MPKSISHAPAGAYAVSDIVRFADESRGLGAKLGIVLVQFPPKHIFCADAADALFKTLGAHLGCPLASEPRHGSWFTEAADALLATLGVARVGADPPRAAAGRDPGGFPGVRYRRMHGSPRIYYSSYEPAVIDTLHTAIVAETTVEDSWCIFDNTAMGAATANAIDLRSRL